MDWVIDHIQIIIAIAGAIAYWLNQRQREKRGESADYDGDGTPEVPERPLQRHGPDADDQERARRIQEEIRRKILERRGHADASTTTEPPRVPPPIDRAEPSPTAAPRPIAGEGLPDVIRRMMEQQQADARARAEAAAQRAEAERRRLQEEEARLEAQRKAELERAEALRAAARRVQAERQQAAEGGPRSAPSWVAGLRDPASLKRAVVVRELLDPPVALRR